MRILQVLRAPVGGLFRHVRDLCEGLAARGHEIGIVVDASSGDGLTGERLAALAPHCTLGITRLPMPRLLGAGDITTPRRIGRIIAGQDIEIVHGHGAKGGLAARLAQAPTGTVRVYTPHGGALHYDPRRPVGALFMAIERRLLARTDTIIFESAYARDTYCARVKTPDCRASVIHNGLAPAEFEPVSPTPDAADFVFIGELRRLKGIDLLLEALAPLAGPDGKPARLVMAGDGPDRALAVDAISRLGLAERVRLAGVRPAREMFAAGHVVVVPSRAESLPYVVLEAGAAGRPVIATRVGGIAEIFGPTAPALIAHGSVSALRQAMEEALAAPASLASATEARRAHIAAHFTIETMVGAIEAEYRRAARLRERA